MYERIIDKVTLSGTVLSKPVLDYEKNGEKFYQMELSISRLSGTADIIPVQFSERRADPSLLYAGNYVKVKGEFRSFNIKVAGEEKTHLRLIVLADMLYLSEDMEQDKNEVELDGHLFKTPYFRKVGVKETPIADLAIAVNHEDGTSSYIPCICWNATAIYAQRNFQVGTHVHLNGRIQSRKFNKLLPDGTVLFKTVYEVSIHTVLEEKEK